ncbi:GlxA family transcriptional regulator [Archangium lansingense]|uniref:Helix-turn-helix domain-containing protein n=1 Tax=Archangium lansingense TaxID=2995310 RepID=A0ABT3ZXJ9_9BACT|nr:helix-turn-helix domain-containing protein [Archangium lansinium]MCY1074125.1 helix-turn-helix domain-containing protein [Archangium lansinium]
MAKRTTSKRLAHVGICLYPGVWGSSASLARDVLHIASAISRARPGSGGIEARFLGARPGDVPTASGMAIRAEESWDRTDVDVIILPSRAVHFLEPEGHPPGLADWITRQHARGCSVLTMTTGSWLLAETGLLQGHTATTHWACLDRCRRQYPGVDWTSDLRLTVTGRIVTARDMQEWLEARYGQPISAKEAARMVHMSPRNLRRRFLEATGQTLSAYLTDIRLARARALLLSSNDAVSQIAHRVGYEDPSTFTALFKEHHGQTPSAYRKSAAGTAD